ncbi:UNVERIFIED_CONTAM: FT-interacting protein 7 [Sesamum radiatum]|uniref:FT-interacting protein 7 n=1 Tax=Sesamum radiatum TaxID=300843 RepID=A0AAW2PWX3_SESRA
MNSTRSKVYFSPTLHYLRVHVIAAQDLVPSDKSRPPDPIVRVELGNQGRTTRPSSMKTINPEWNEELMYVAWEPFNENIVVSVEDKDEVIGRVLIPLRNVKRRVENAKLPDAQWFGLQKPSLVKDEGGRRKINSLVEFIFDLP